MKCVSKPLLQMHSRFDFARNKMAVINVKILLLCIIVLSERCASLNDKNGFLNNNAPADATKTRFEVCKKKIIRTIHIMTYGNLNLDKLKLLISRISNKNISGPSK